MDNKELEPKSIAVVTAAAANIGITHTIGVYYDSNDTKPIFTPVNPTPDIEPDDEHEGIKDDDEDNDDEDDTVKEVYLPK